METTEDTSDRRLAQSATASHSKKTTMKSPTIRARIAR